jgi:hypothetical protein
MYSSMLANLDKEQKNSLPHSDLRTQFLTGFRVGFWVSEPKPEPDFFGFENPNPKKFGFKIRYTRKNYTSAIVTGFKIHFPL